VRYIGGSLIRRANKRQRKTVRRARESTTRTARNRTPVTNLKTTLSRIRSFNVNGKRRQVRSLFYIRNLEKGQARAERRSLVVTLRTIKSLAVTRRTITIRARSQRRS
jgi:hypothetical protein